MWPEETWNKIYNAAGTRRIIKKKNVPYNFIKTQQGGISECYFNELTDKISAKTARHSKLGSIQSH